MRPTAIALPLAAFLLLLTLPATAAYKDVLIKDVPHVTQKPDFCGEACVEMWTRYLKHPITQDQVYNESGLDPATARGCYTADMLKALVKIGFKPGPAWNKYPIKDAPTSLDAAFADLHADLLAGIPSIVCMHAQDKPQTTEHFRLILGFDRKTDEVIYHEPAEDHAAYRHMPRATFLKLWPLKSDADHEMAIRLKLESAKLKDIPPADSFTDADYCQHIIALKARLPRGFNLVLQRPFVVVGDESFARVESHAERTVRWATDKLKAEYFAKDPLTSSTSGSSKIRKATRPTSKNSSAQLPPPPTATTPPPTRPSS